MDLNDLLRIASGLSPDTVIRIKMAHGNVEVAKSELEDITGALVLVPSNAAPFLREAENNE